MSEPTSKQWASIQMVPWHELVSFVGGLYPRGGRIGTSDPNKTLAVMNDHELLAEIADRLFSIRIGYSAKAEPLRQQIMKIENDKAADLRKLREEITSRRPS